MKRFKLDFIRTDVTRSSLVVEVADDQDINEIIDRILMQEDDNLDDKAGVSLGEWEIEEIKRI